MERRFKKNDIYIMPKYIYFFLNCGKLGALRARYKYIPRAPSCTGTANLLGLTQGQKLSGNSRHNRHDLLNSFTSTSDFELLGIMLLCIN